MSAFLYGFFVAFHIAEASANCMKFKHTEEREMNQKHSLTEGNILKSLLTFAIPVLFSLLLQALYGGADLLIVGRFADTVDVSGVATGSMLLSTVMNIITGLSMGITIAVAEKVCVFIMLVPSAYMQSMSAFGAQNMGAGNPKRADRALLCGVSTAFCVCLIMCVLTFFHGDLMAALFSSDAAVTSMDVRKRCLSCCRA